MPGSWRWGIILSILIIVLIAQGGSANRGWSASFGDEIHSAQAGGGSVYLIIEQDSEMYLSRVDNGSQIWRSPLPWGTPPVIPAVSGSIVICAFGSGTAGINITDGSLMWNISVELADDPAADGGMMFLSNGTRLMAHDTGPQHGELWNASIVGELMFIVPTDDVIMLGHDDGTVSILNRTDGSTEWVVSPEGVDLGRPFLDGDILYLVSGNSTTGNLNAINVDGYYIEWTSDVGPTSAAPFAFDGVTVVTEDGTVRSFDDNGTEVRTDPTGLEVDRTMEYDGDIYALSPSGNLTKVEVVNGTAVPGWNLSITEGLLPIGEIGGLVHMYTRDGRIVAIDDAPMQDPYLVPGSLFLEHDPPLEGYEDTVILTAGNRGTAASRIEVILRLDGEVLANRIIMLEPGEIASIEFVWEPEAGEATLTVTLDVDGDEISYEHDELEITTNVTPTADEDDVDMLTTIFVGLIILWGLLIGIAIFARKYIHRKRSIGGKGEAEEDKNKGPG